MSQSPGDIKSHIISVLLELNRPTSVPELGAACFARNAIDGTRKSVGLAVDEAVGVMLAEGILKIDGYTVGSARTTFVEILDVLTAMTMAVEASR